MKPKALDLFCGAGGVARGLQLAGFHVTGVDFYEQPNYVGDDFDRRDAMNVPLDGYDFIWASPPCQGYSDLRNMTAVAYPKLLPAVRERLTTVSVPWVIENVEGAPLHYPLLLCGTMFSGLRVIRHRLFECSTLLLSPHHPKHPLVFTHDKRKAHHGKLNEWESFVQVTGGGNCSMRNACAAMGIDWMTKHELNQAIPPAYSKYIGEQMMPHVLRAMRNRSKVAA